MAKILLGIVAVIACFMLVESLKCNKCSLGLIGFCILGSEETCSGNQTVCYTAEAKFDKVPIKGFVTQGCKVNSTACGTSQSSSIALLPIVTYTTTVTCCSTDKCNPVDTSDATTVKMTFTAAMGAAVLASAWGSML
ncbi:long neurotoxin 469-like [Cynoglossus semilaevis]|uniref:long neurotoxin 469-like n=1 Tax=Cynoglossus semilaevis TaxID=244447 RepID=UPI0007DCAB15|nr:long neurotoxin 469-like [Cynoglossus semilaevis]